MAGVPTGTRRRPGVGRCRGSLQRGTRQPSSGRRSGRWPRIGRGGDDHGHPERVGHRIAPGHRPRRRLETRRAPGVRPPRGLAPDAIGHELTDGTSAARRVRDIDIRHSSARARHGGDHADHAPDRPRRPGGDRGVHLDGRGPRSSGMHSSTSACRWSLACSAR